MPRSGPTQPLTATQRMLVTHLLDALAPDGLVYALLSVRGGRLVELDCVSSSGLGFFPQELATLAGWRDSESAISPSS